jgi:cell division protein FtsI (penicillin-binding protein 3)
MRVIDRRVKILFILGVAGTCLIMARLAHLQVFQGHEYARKAFRSHYRRVEISSLRGAIWDRNGHLLAVSLAGDSLCADPVQIDNPETLADALSNILPGTADDYSQKLRQTNRRFVWLQRGITPSQAAGVKQLNAPGLFFRKENMRFYPAGADLASVIGFTGIDDVGLEGLEAKYDIFLAGVPGEELIAYDALARPYSYESIILSEPQSGQNLHLTLDKTIQYIAVSELRKKMTSESAEWGSVVVMDVHTGAVLAMVSEPSFNPHRFSESASENRRNRAVSQLFEPGSTFKAITLSAALESKTVSLHETIDCSQGRLTIGSYSFNDWKNLGFITPEDIIVYSSNVGTIKMAQKTGGDVLYSMARDFGIGHNPNRDIPGSEAGYIQTPDIWNSLATASLSIGYGVAVTPIQMASVYATFANGGYRVRPHVIQNQSNHAPKRIISKQTADIVSNILYQTIARGTAVNAMPELFSASGKTGTARRYDHDKKRYIPGSVTCVFTGFAPFEDPRISITIIIDDPKIHTWASQITADVFSNIANQTLLYMGEIPGKKVSA